MEDAPAVDWTAFRTRFPALAGRTYLNTAGGGPVSERAAAAGTRYYEEAAHEADTAWGRWLDRLESARLSVAEWIGGESERISFLPNSSLGMNIVARSYETPMTVLALKSEFPSCTTPFIRAGHAVVFADTPMDGRVTPETLERAAPPGIDMLVLSSVQYANGFRADLTAIGAWCRSRDVAFVVDATQSISAFPIHVERDSIDYLVFSGYKWATAGYGNAVLCAGPDAPATDPPLVGWRSARNAYELENERPELIPFGAGHEMGHPLFPTAFTLAEAVRVMAEPGIDAVSNRILTLVSRLRRGLADRDLPVRTTEDPLAWSGITLLEGRSIGGGPTGERRIPRPEAVAAELERRSVYVSARDGGVRISLHAYNSPADVDSFLESLDDMLERS